MALTRSMEFLKKILKFNLNVTFSNRWKDSAHIEPWFTWSFIDFLKPRLHYNLDILEYGSGSSTLWFSQLCQAVCAVESDVKYFRNIYDKCLPNVKILLRSQYFESYQNCSFDGFDKFDIIIIDGKRRLECAQVSLSRLKENGVIILDDSHRCHYQPIRETLAQAGFSELSFSGIKRNVPFITSTSLFYRKNSNCLDV